MTKWLFTKCILLIALLTMPSGIQAQMSKQLYKALSDTIKPKNRMRIQLKEAGPILRTYYDIPDPVLRDQLSGLAQILGPAYSSISDLNQRVQFINDLSWFWYQRNALDSVDKYSGIALEQAMRFPLLDQKKKAYAKKIQAYVKLDREDFSSAYADFHTAIDIFNSFGEFEQISDCLSGTLMIFQKLQLHDRVITSADSTLSFVSKNTNPNFQKHLKQYLLLIKARAYIAKFSGRSSPLSADSAWIILDKIVQVKEFSQFRWRIEAYTELARLAYHKKEYNESILYADSAFALEGSHILENTNKNVRLIYKGLSLLNSGKDQKGISLLKSVNRKKNSDHSSLLLNRLVEYELEHGNYKIALVYHKELLEQVRHSEILAHQGRVFELEGKYNILVKDLKINSLQKKEQELLRVIMVIVMLVAMLGLFIWNRYRVAHNKTQILVSQLAELTDIQIIRLQDAETRIRKKIAQDLHDDFSASIAASAQFIKAQALKETDSEDQKKLNLVVTILQDSYRKARKLAHQIYFDESEAKFWEGLTDYITLFFSGSKIDLNVEVQPEDLTLSSDTKIVLLRTVKEALVNVLKHSNASCVQILIFADVQWINLEIADNGKGISKSNKKGIGLNSIEKRIHNIGGRFSIENPPEGGFKLKVRLPVCNL